MKLLPGLVLFLVLGLIGYAVGARYSGRPTNAQSKTSQENGAISAEPVQGKSDTSIRDPRSGATFGESRERLTSLAEQVGSKVDTGALLEGTRAATNLLEIERIFALANKEEMVLFFAEETTSDMKPAVLTAAYARLAELSSEDAVAIWSDQFQRDGSDAGIDGLVRSWAKQDAAAAELWIDNLSSEKTRSKALFALLDSVVESNPELVDRRLTEVGDLFQSIHLASLLAWEIEPGKFSPLAEKFLSEKQGKWQYQNQLVSLLEIWGKRDSAAMMAWLTSRSPGEFQSHVIPRVAKTRADSDPAAFAREIGPSLADNSALAEMAGQAWLNWINKGGDDEAAMKWVEIYGEHLQLGQGASWMSGEWTTERADRVLPLAAKLPDGEFKDTFTRTILHSLSRIDPRTALEYAQELLPPGNDSDMFIASALSNLARDGNPEEALDLAMKNLKPGQGQNDAVRFVMSPWVDQDPFAAVRNAKALPEKLREQAYDGIAYRWAEKAPKQLLDFLQSSPDPAVATALAKDSFWSFGYHLGGESYLATALEFPDESMRKEAVEGLFGGWSSANLETSGEALNQLESGPIRDIAISKFVSSASSTDREAALVWSLEIGDDAKRRQTTLQQSRYWLKADRPAAVQWIKANESMPAEWKDELLKPKG